MKGEVETQGQKFQGPSMVLVLKTDCGSRRKTPVSPPSAQTWVLGYPELMREPQKEAEKMGDTWLCQELLKIFMNLLCSSCSHHGMETT